MLTCPNMTWMSLALRKDKAGLWTHFSGDWELPCFLPSLVGWQTTSTFQLPLLDSIFHVNSLLFGGMMGLFASLALSAIAYLQKLEADSAKKK